MTWSLGEPPLYRDKVFFSISEHEAAYRNGGLEYNVYSYAAEGERVYTGSGLWIIVSRPLGQSGGRGPRWPGLAKTLAKPAGRPGPGGLAEARLYGGRTRLGVADVGQDDLMDVLEAALSSVDEQCTSVEIVVTYSLSERRIEHLEGEAEEEKGVSELLLSVVCGRRGFSVYMAETGFDESGLARLASVAASTLSTLAKTFSQRERALSPLASGRWIIVLRHDAAAALLHELGHLLEAGRGAGKGARLASSELDVYDDPFFESSPATRFFDDEAVACMRKKLVEDGVIVDSLDTRETALATGGRPGNAYGLFHRPVPRHTTLVLKPGDWREEEILEETRRAIVVDSVHIAYLDNHRIVLIPERAWLLERRELTPLRIKSIVFRIPDSLTTIDAVGRKAWLRTSVEKGSILAEAAPPIRLVGYAE